MGKKSTKYEYEQRLRKVADLIIAGKMRFEIISELTILWGVTPSQIDKYIAAIHENMNLERVGIDGGELLLKYNALYISAKDDKWLQHNILNSIAKITLLKEKKIDITSNGETISYMINFGIVDEDKIETDDKEKGSSS